MAGELDEERSQNLSKTLDFGTIIYENWAMDIYSQVIELGLPTLQCKECGYRWHPRKPKMPTRCPNPDCGTRCWCRERKDGKDGHKP
jgi:hypothetical protein